MSDKSSPESTAKQSPRSIMLSLSITLVLILLFGLGFIILFGTNAWNTELEHQRTNLYLEYTDLVEESLLGPLSLGEYETVQSISQAYAYNQGIVALEVRDAVDHTIFLYREEGQSTFTGVRKELRYQGEFLGTLSLEVSSAFIERYSIGFFWTFLISSIGILFTMAVLYFFGIRQLLTSNLAKIQGSIQDYITGQKNTFTNVTNIKEFQPLYDLLDYMSATIESQMVTLNRTLYGVENSNIGIYILNEDGYISYSNKKAAQQLGFRRHELTDRRFADLDSGWPQRKWTENDGKALTYQTAFQRKDLSMISVEVYANRFIMDREELVFCFVEDISLREKARHEMLASEERFFTFMNHAPFFAYIKDQNLKHVFLNQKTKDLQHQKDNEKAGSFFDHDTAAMLEKADKEILAGRQERMNLEFQVDLPQGRMWIRDIKFPIRQADGSRYIGGLGVDITEQKRYEKAILSAKELAEAANKVKSDFLANMSHELRTPLNGLLGMINLLQTEELSPAGKSYLDIAVLSAQKMHAIVEDLITLADLENREPSLFRELVDVKELFMAICDGVQPSVQEKGLDLNLQMPEEDVNLLTIPPRFSQVVLGLVTNAVKFSEKGIITVSLKKTDTGIAFRVTDQGIGIPEERMEEIFEPLRQLEDPYTKKHGGIGAGLSIVKKTLDTLGGRIEVTSTLGEGTSFFVQLDDLGESAEAGSPPSPIAPKTEEPEKIQGPKILIVEDEAVNRLYLKMILGRFGCEVTEAQDGFEAISWCEENRPDLIFMDIGLPELNGVETSQRIHALQSLESIPIIALTAHTHTSDVRSFLEGGLDQVVKKPFMEGQIRLVLEEYLGKRRLADIAPEN